MPSSSIEGNGLGPLTRTPGLILPHAHCYSIPELLELPADEPRIRANNLQPYTVQMRVLRKRKVIEHQKPADLEMRYYVSQVLRGPSFGMIPIHCNHIKVHARMRREEPG